MLRSVIFCALVMLLVAPLEARAFVAGGPMEATREILVSSNGIVRGPGDREQKLDALKSLLREFLDTQALGRQSMGRKAG